MRRCQALARSVLSMPASGQRPRRQRRRLTDRERDGSSRSESFWARMHPQTQSGGTTEGWPRFWSQWMPHATGRFCSTARCNNWPRTNSLRCSRITIQGPRSVRGPARPTGSSSNSTRGSTRNTRARHAPQLDQTCCENLRSRCERFNTHQGVPFDRGERLRARTAAGSFGSLYAFCFVIGVTPLGTV